LREASARQNQTLLTPGGSQSPGVSCQNIQFFKDLDGSKSFFLMGYLDGRFPGHKAVARLHAKAYIT
jgi:hypothetical protein